MTIERMAYLTDEDQIGGNDPRLRDFWKEAQRLATESGQCAVFDNLAEALGGPRRPVAVTVPLYMNVRVYITTETQDGETPEDAIRRIENNRYSAITHDQIENARTRINEGNYTLYTAEDMRMAN